MADRPTAWAPPVRLLKLAAAGITACVALGSCAAHAPVSRIDPLTTAVSQILDRRNQALGHGDQAGFVADLDPSNTGLIAHERMVFANLRQFRFTVLSYLLGSSDGIALDASDAANSYHRPATLFLVRLRMEVADVDADVSEARFAYLVATVASQLRIVGIDPVGPASRQFLAGSQHDLPWELTPLKAIRQGDVIVVGDDTVENLESMAAGAAVASVEVRSLWGGRQAPRASLLFLTRSQETFGRWFGPGRDVGQVDGITFPVQGVSSLSLKRPAFVGARITVNLSSPLSSSSGALLMRHELTHSLTILAAYPVLTATRSAGPRRWLVEGFARWVEVLDSPAAQQHQLELIRAGGGATGRLPADETFYNASAVALNYALGWSVFSLLQKQLGVDRTVGVYADAVRLGSGADSDFDNALRRARVDPGTFTSQWQAYVRG